jgi:hypothetical protein
MKAVRLSALRTGCLYAPRKYSWYLFLLEAELTSEPQCDQKEYINEEFQWHRESNPRPAGLLSNASTNCATACPLLYLLYPMSRRLGVAQSLYGCFVQKKISYNLRQSNPASSLFLPFTQSLHWQSYPGSVFMSKWHMSVCTSERAEHEWSDFPYLKHVHVRGFRFPDAGRSENFPLIHWERTEEGDRRIGLAREKNFRMFWC